MRIPISVSPLTFRFPGRVLITVSTITPPAPATSPFFAGAFWTAGASAARPRFRTHGNFSHHECFSSARKRRRRSRSAGALHIVAFGCGWVFAGERARPGCRFRRRAAAPENSPAIYGWVHGSGMFQVPPGTKEFFCRPSRDLFIWLTRYPAMNGWAIVIASLRDFAAFAPFARQKFKHPLPRSSTPNCHWPVLAPGHQLGICRGARPSRWPFSASRQNWFHAPPHPGPLPQLPLAEREKRAPSF